MQNVLNDLNCGTNTLNISWVPGSMPVNHSATAVAADGTTLKCITEGSSCMMTNLQCGEQYAVAVTAVSSTCNGPSSVPEIINSGKIECIQEKKNYKIIFFALTEHNLTSSSFSFLISLSVPCVPDNIQGAVECSSNTLQASWNTAAGAVSYISTLTGAGHFSVSCPTANQSCHFPGLQCAHTYMLSVVALNNRCNSSESAKISVITGKC